MQITTKEDNEKYTIRAEPPIVNLKGGQACEYEIYMQALCTLDVSDEIILSVLNIKTGETKQIPFTIKMKTKLTTKLDPDELKEEKKLGEGSFGIVYLGDFRGNKVAIKKMKSVEETEESLDEFEREVAMLDKFKHDYIVHFYGAVFIPQKICMVTEFAPYGSIQDLMKKYPDSDEISEKLRVKFCLDCSKGIQYLHGNGILHRDIKPDNFLVLSLDETVPVNCKLTDFGATRNVNQIMTNMTFTKGVGTPAYMAPEILKREKYKKQSDVYSFAITMLEVMIWHTAFPKDDFRFAWNIADSISAGKRPQTIEIVKNKNIRKLIEQCWCQKPKERLTINDVVPLLETELIKLK